MPNSTLVSFLILFLLMGAPALAQAPSPGSLSDLIDSPSGNPFAEVDEPSASSSSAASSAKSKSNDSLLESKDRESFSSSSSQATYTKGFINLGALEIELHLAESKFRSNPEVLERSILVRTYERIVLSLCFPPFSYLVGKQSLTIDPRCKENLEALRKLHSNNTILICAESGVDSPECSDSFQDQHVREYDIAESRKYDLSERHTNILDKPAIQTRFTTLQKQLIAAINELKSERSVTNLKAVNGSLFEMLGLICSDDAVELTYERPVAEPLLPDTGPNVEISLLDALEALEKDTMKTPTPTPTPIPVDLSNKFFRTRILSDKCFDTISEALLIDTRLSAATCYREGFISPACLSAQRRFLSLKEEAKFAPSEPTPEDGLASF